MVSPKERRELQKKVLSWYDQNKRDLPWRKTLDPYAILVSEVMLQQTQVDRVVPFYERWLKEFPGFQDLAKADKVKLLGLWSGLGYNSRALRLQKLAQVVVGRYSGKLPKSEEELLSLPGIGPYTAAAILAFAFNKEAHVIDTNIRRVLIHELHLKEDIATEDLKKIAFELIPKGKSRVWHNAMMDYGALEKTARKTGVMSLSKQPKFDGSERKVRGEIVRYLLKVKEASVADVQERYAHKNFEKILDKMEKDGLITQKEGRVAIK